MNSFEYILSYLPLALAIAVGIFVVRKSGIFEQREHRRRVEELLERIAKAVEARAK